MAKIIQIAVCGVADNEHTQGDMMLFALDSDGHVHCLDNRKWTWQPVTDPPEWNPNGQ